MRHPKICGMVRKYPDDPVSVSFPIANFKSIKSIDFILYNTHLKTLLTNYFSMFTLTDAILLVRKIIVGILIFLLPLTIIGGGIWLLMQFLKQ